MMIENASPAAEQEIEISVEDDAVVEANASPDDELEAYTKGVSKRINKLTAKTREAEERAAIASRRRYTKSRSRCGCQRTTS
jgi:hypothetical protein